MRFSWMWNAASGEMRKVPVGTLSEFESPRLSAMVGRLMRCALLLGLAGCAAQSPQRYASSSREYFPESVYGRASPRLVADGRPIPRGGGQYLVGHPYTVAGRTYYPSEKPRSSEVGTASYYGGAFHGRRTANGEIYDMSSVSAAHPTMPLPSYARVTNLSNHRSIIVRVNDRGPYAAGRVMDVSDRAAQLLDFKRIGTAKVRVDYIGPAGLDGQDNDMLMASLRTDGSPAELGGHSGTMLAAAQPEAVPVASAALSPEATTRVAEIPSRPDPVAVATELRATAQMPAYAPLPPERPFDLGTIPGAAIPIAATRQHQAAATLYRGSAPGLVRISGQPEFVR
jgi:rare lipoprotein A